MAVIHVVEDESLVRGYLGDMLSEAGQQVIEAEKADEAIALLETRRDIHIIFTDINMPGSMDGVRLAAVVRDRWPPVRIIVASGAARLHQRIPGPVLPTIRRNANSDPTAAAG
jgi:CheY-like chemotaxis protein